MIQGSLKDIPAGSKEQETWPWKVDLSVLGRPDDGKRYWPKISIITPSLNQGKFIEQAIRSVLLQGYPNLEYIIIDGGSKDDSAGIIKKYDKFIAYWVSEPDSGHGNAINKGFSRATGEIMAWLNSDDMYAPGALFSVAEVFGGFKDVQWITGVNSFWNKDDERTAIDIEYKNIYDFMLGRYKWIGQESTFWRRSLWEAAGGRINDKYRLMVDSELWCRFFLLAELWNVDTILAGYRQYDSNRARVYYNECCHETEKAISELSNNCPGEVRRRAMALRCIKPLKGLFRHLHMPGLSRRMFGRFLESMAYKKLVIKDGIWAKTILPFEL